MQILIDKRLRPGKGIIYITLKGQREDELSLYFNKSFFIIG